MKSSFKQQSFTPVPVQTSAALNKSVSFRMGVNGAPSNTEERKQIHEKVYTKEELDQLLNMKKTPPSSEPNIKTTP